MIITKTIIIIVKGDTMTAKPKKHSKKRDAIREALMNTKEHPSAEMLYTKLKCDIPDLSLATVYRNLNEFIADGEAVCVGAVNSQERFDANTKPHTHFICEKCSRVLDLDCFNEDSRLDSEAQNGFGGTVRCHSLVFYGLCPECVNNA